jgi:hypothetical protein
MREPIAPLFSCDECCEEVRTLTALLVVVFIVVIGPLAVLSGVDSRLDDRRNGWP